MKNEKIREEVANYLDKQFWKYKRYDCMPENDVGYETIDHSDLLKIADGLIPMIKGLLKSENKIS